MHANQTLANPITERLFVECLLSEIQVEQTRFDRDLRSAKREKVALPVSIRYENRCENERISGVTRDLSSSGACIIAEREFHEHDKASIEIYRLNGDPKSILSECRWCKPFGGHFWLSGWQFVTVEK